VNEVLEQENPVDIEAMKALQTDYYSIPASLLIPYLASIEFDNELINEAKEKLLNWDFELNKSSIPAAIYVAWENEIKNYSRNLFIPENVNNLLYIQLKTTINWIEYPEKMFGTEEERNKFLETSFKTAIADLSSRLGSNINKWQYGQELNKHVQISHALGRILDDSLSQLLNVGPLPRGGNAYTPGSTGSNYNQTSGASFRLIVDTGNWDKAIGTNSPGQSGNPKSEFYNNLFRSWANDEYFPVYYSKEKIKEVAVETVTLSPQGN
jgi:penicillin amidase